MKHMTSLQRTSRALSAVLFSALMLGPSLARAAECPAESPEDAQERRKLAKEWFGMAEAAESASNDAEAVRAYACSYKMVAHPFTAFNLGRVAEHSGDNELALKMFKAYLTLKPDAEDREDVQMRIKGIEDKLAAAAAPPDVLTAPSDQPPTEPPAEPPVADTPPPGPAPGVSRRAEPEPAPEGPPSRVVEWVVGGVAVATLGVGLGLNLAARTKMSACQADADKGQNKTANDECEAARPLAYTSYAMFGIAAAGIVTDALLLILRHKEGGSSSSSGDEASVGFAPLPGGAALMARGRF
jgi:hypothetical protein